MTENAYGTTIPSSVSQTYYDAQAVIDSAILVWEQMDLSTAQIMYGIAMMNLESGDDPTVTNSVPGSSIRGLGQFSDANWNHVAGQLDSTYKLAPGSLFYISQSLSGPTNQNFVVTQPAYTNAQAGRSNDPGAGQYDPEGLVEQLEVVGQGIVNEWNDAENELTNGTRAASGLAALIGSDAKGSALLEPSSPGSSTLLATVALAYLNHHQGLSWWNSPSNITKAKNYLNGVTANGQKTTPGSSDLESVLTAFQDEFTFLQQHAGVSSPVNESGVAETTITAVQLNDVPASTLLVGDPWQMAGATTDITQNIPSIFRTPDNFLSQTNGGLSSFTTVSTGNITSYTYTTNASAGTAVVSGFATYNFTTDTGSGKETLGDGSTVNYTETDSPQYGTLVTETTTSASGEQLSSEDETRHIIGGSETDSTVMYSGLQLQSAILVYFNLFNQTQVQGDYNSNNQLIGIYLSEAFPSTAAELPQTQYIPLTPGQAGYEQTAASYGLPTTDPYANSNGSAISNVLSSEALSTLSSTDGTTLATESADPGVQASAVLGNGLTLTWSLGSNGQITGQSLVATNGTAEQNNFNSAGQFVGTTSTTGDPADGVVTTYTYDAQGNEAGYSTVTPYGPGTSITVNGVSTTYANGFTVTSQYDPSGDLLSFSVVGTVENSDGSSTTTETDYTTTVNSDGSVTDQLAGYIVTNVLGNDATSTDYNSGGSVTGSSTLTVNPDGSTTTENFNASGALTGSSNLSLDSAGDITLQSFDSSGSLTDSKTLSGSGTLTDTTYVDGESSGQAISVVALDGTSATTYFSPGGSLIGDAWINPDGSYGSDTVEAGGGSVGTANYTDGSQSSSVNDGQGDITTTNFSPSGTESGTTDIVIGSSGISSAFTSSDGSVTSAAAFQEDGSTQATIAETNGSSVGMSLDPAGNFDWMQADSGGQTTAVLLDSDGEVTGTTATSQSTGGVRTTISYDTAGEETGYTVQTIDDTGETTADYANQGGQFLETGYEQVTSSDGATTTAEYSIAGGVATETGYTVSSTNADGAMTTASYSLNPNGDGSFVETGEDAVSPNLQGLVTMDEFDASGNLTGYETERIDSAGDILLTQYDAAGDWLQQGTVFASGVVQDVLYNTSSGTVTTTWQTDGSYQQVTDDGEGDATTTNYSATGVALSDTWTQSDGSYGSDTYSADGSSSGSSYNTDGSYSTYTEDAEGNTVTENYSPVGVVESEEESLNDGQGDSVTVGFDASGDLTGQIWVTSDGGTGTESFSTQGTNLESNLTTLSGVGESAVGSAQGGLVIGWGGQETLTAGAGPTLVDGVSADDLIIGGAGSDTLEAFSAGSTLIGGSGSDLFEVNDPTDVVQDGTGVDSVLSSVSYTVPTDVDVLTLTGTENLTATGNGDAGNLITGNSGDDTLVAGSGSDTLVAGSGNDTLVAGSGTDLLEGSGASTTYLFNSGFGQAEIQPGGNGGGIEFGAGITPEDLSVGLTTDSNGSPALLIEDGSGSITVDGGLDGSIGLFSFADGTHLSVPELFAASTVLNGATGNAIFNTSSAVSLTGGSGQDTIFAWGNDDTLVAGSGGADIFAEGADDLVTGSSASDTLDAAAAGTTLVGGTGNEVFEVSDPTDVVQAQAGAASNLIYSSVSYTLPSNVDELTLIGPADLSATGNNDAGNLIIGNAGDDTLVAGSGSDTLVSGGGVDSLVGGGGTDTFVVNNSADAVVPASYAVGQDTIDSSVSYDLTAPVATVNLTGSADLSVTDDYGYATITGNGGNDTLTGGSGSDTLVAGSGVDTFEAGSGDNTFVVNNTGDVIELGNSPGNDTVESSVGYTLGQGLDTLLLTGSADLEGQGNGDFSNLIQANSGNDTLIAGSGNDSLVGGSGDDVLIAGSGADTLTAGTGIDTFEAGSGNETFVVNNVDDVIQVGGAPGDDLVESSVSYTLGQGLDNLQLTGSANLEGQGNADASNQLQANSGNDTLIAGSGSDSLFGGSGNDTLVAGAGLDTLTGGSGSDSLVGGSGYDLLVGGSGSDTLVAGTGVDTLEAGTGNNTFIINNVNDLIEVNGSTGSSTVESSVSYTLAQGLDTLELTGSARVAGQGNADASNLIEGNSASDTLTAGSGSDTLIAGAGADTLIAGSGSDSLVAGSGSDSLVAGSGNDTLVAGTGTDVLQGGTGSTTYLLDSGFGQVNIYAAQGTGVIQFGAGIALSDLTVGLTTDLAGNPALLIQDGSSAVTVGGGLTSGIEEFEFADGAQLSLSALLASATDVSGSVTGSNADAILNASNSASLSGSGDDTIFGTGASDTLIAGIGDEYLLAAGDDASVSGGLGADTLIGAGADDTVEAGSGSQQLYGLGTGDVLVGGIGDDTLNGGAGPDTLVAGSGNTYINGSSAGDTILLSAGGTLTLNPSSTSASEVIELPSGTTLADFTAYEGAHGSLILQNPSDGTTAVLNGYYSSGSSGTLWMIANSGGQAQLLSDWVDSLPQSNSSYEQEINSAEGAFAASLTGTLNQIGQQGGTLSNPGNTAASTEPGYEYQFNGVTTENVTVQGGALTIGNSEDYQSTSTNLQTGSTTEPVTTPVYSEVTIPGWQEFIPDSSLTQQEIGNLENEASGNNGQGLSVQPGTNSSGESGYTVTSLPYTEYEQTGTQTTEETVPEYTTSTQASQSLTVYNITGDGGNDVITTGSIIYNQYEQDVGPYFVGTVNTGNGNVSVNLGMNNGYQIGRDLTYYPGDALAPGAFIEGGSGNDTIVGTAGADVIAAGTGYDRIDAAFGSTVYVPLEGASTEDIYIEGPFYGGAPFPSSTLVLPEGITPQALSYRLITDVPNGYTGEFGANTGDELQITYGDSSILIPFNFNPDAQYDQAPQQVTIGAIVDENNDGIESFQFADGTVLTRDQILAMAGPAISIGNFNPTVIALNPAVTADSAISGTSLFRGSDSSGLPITWYQVSNTGTNGGYFELDGVAQTSGKSFYVSVDQLPDLTYVSGAAGSSDDISVSAFDGVVWGSANSFSVSVQSSSLYQATAADQQVTGGASGPDTLVGGYGGDTLVGSSGGDTFDYNVGGGAEEIQESAASSSTNDNVLQFGSGITVSSLSLSVAAGSELVLSTGSGNDSVSIDGFNPLNPLQSFPIQSFAFSDGTHLTLLQLLSDNAVTGTSGSITNADGSVTSYEFTPSGQQIYYAQNVNTSGQVTASVSLNSEGSETTDSYTYGADGSYSDTVVSTPPGGGGSTTTVDGFNASGNLLSQQVQNPDGSGSSQTWNTQGQTLSYDVTNANGSTSDSSYAWNADGSYTETTVATPAGGGASTTTVDGFNASGNLLSQQVQNPDGSGSSQTWNTQGQTLSYDVTNADGSTSDSSYAWNADGSYTETTVATPAGGGASTTTVDGFNASGNLLSQEVQNPDGSSTSQTWNPQGQTLTYDVTSTDGSTSDSSYAWNSDGSYTETTVATPAGGGASTTTVDGFNASGNLLSQQVQNADGSSTSQTWNPQGQTLTYDVTSTDGSTSDSSYAWNSDGSYTETTVATPAGGGASTTTVDGFNASGNLLSQQVQNPDGSSTSQTWNPQGQTLTYDVTSADGSTSDSTFAYNSDGSYSDTVVSTPADGGTPTTTAYDYSTQGSLLNENAYTPGSDGSYTDTWSQADGSKGTYWWNASTSTYEDIWYDSNGSSWTDEYQYASGGSPATTGYSFLETYSASDGSQGSRQYDAAMGAVTVSWDSASTGQLNGTTTDSGFYGLQNESELTNTQQDLTFFNPNVSPNFSAFLDAH